VKVEVYYSKATGRTEVLDAAIQAAADEAGVVLPEVEYIEVYDDGDARAKHCLGSPSVRINGLDVEYVEREPPEYHAGVRYYSTSSGWKPVPKHDQMVSLFEQMKRKEAAGA